MQTTPALFGAVSAVAAMPASADDPASGEGFAESLAAALFAQAPQDAPLAVPNPEVLPGSPEATLIDKAAQVKTALDAARGLPEARTAEPQVSPPDGARTGRADASLFQANAVAEAPAVGPKTAPPVTTAATFAPATPVGAVRASSPTPLQPATAGVESLLEDAAGQVLAVRAHAVERAVSEAAGKAPTAAAFTERAALSPAIAPAGQALAQKSALRRDTATATVEEPKAGKAAGAALKPALVNPARVEFALVSTETAAEPDEPALDPAMARPAHAHAAEYTGDRGAGLALEPRQTPGPAPLLAAGLQQAARIAPQTVAALSADIARKLEGRHSRFDIALDPAGLGRVDVRVEIGPAGAMAASLTFDNPQAAEALKGRAHELHAALEQAGFDLSGGLSFTSNGADREAQREHHAFAAPARDGLRIAELADEAAAVQPRARAPRPGGLDIRI